MRRPSPRGHINAVPLPDIRDRLRDLFEVFGLPGALRVDNGGPWGKPQNTPSWLALWLAGLGIRILWIRPRTPKDNPQIERCNRLIDDWSEPHTCDALAQWQRRLDHLVHRQRDEYPVQDGLSRTTLHPEFYTVSPDRRYGRANESQVWQLAQARQLLAQFSWQRVVSATGQITVMNQRFSVGSRHRGHKVQVRYDAQANVYVVTALDDPVGAVIARQPAHDMTAETIMSLTSTSRTRRKLSPACTHTYQTCSASD